MNVLRNAVLIVNSNGDVLRTQGILWKIIYVVTIKVISSNKYIDFNVMLDTSNKAIMFDNYEDAIEAGLKYCLKSI